MSPRALEPVAALDLYAGDGLRLRDASRLARVVESSGLGGLWTLEAQTEPFQPLALAAEATERIQLGTAVAVALARNPMVVAHLAHELNDFSGGRFSLGLGSQVGAHIVSRYGEEFEHPAARMREFVQALRAIWATWNYGARLNFRGEFYRHTLMTPMFSPAPSGFGAPRVLLSAVGPVMTRVACEVADGLIAHPLTSVRVVQELLRPRVADAAADDFELVLPALVITGETAADLDTARSAVRKQLAFYASTPAYRPVMELHGAGEVADELHTMSRRMLWDEMTALISDEVLDAFSVEALLPDLTTALHSRFDGVVDRVLVYAPYAVPTDAWAVL